MALIQAAAPATSKPIRYDIVDNHTKTVVGACKTRVAASKAVDKRDNAYGACRYSAVAVWG